MAVIDFKGQNYKKLRDALLKKNSLFIDEHFPANNKSLSYDKMEDQVTWKRPLEFCTSHPKFAVGEEMKCDIKTSTKEHNWFTSVCNQLRHDQKTWKEVYKQRLTDWTNKASYAGIFCFRFWRYTNWVDVVIDDFLPTVDGKPIFCYSESQQQIWCSLLEKAYAKLYGDYETLKECYAVDAMADLTGGVSYKYSDIDDANSNQICDDIREALEEKCFVSAYLKPHASGVDGEVKADITPGSCYTVSCIDMLKYPSKKYMIRLRNYDCYDHFSGAIVEGSKDYQALAETDRLVLTLEHPADFWIAFSQFLGHLERLEICYVFNTSLLTCKRRWHVSLKPGDWTTGAVGTDTDRSGGSAQYGSFFRNPQYSFNITSKGDVALSLEQVDTSLGRADGKLHILTVGMHVLRVEQNRLYRLHSMQSTAAVSSYVQRRNAFLKLKLDHGRYVVFPSTDEPGSVGPFVLRLYTRSEASLRELTRHHPRHIMCTKPYTMITRLSILKVRGLANLNVKQKLIFLEARCERTVVTSIVFTPNEEGDITPNFFALFYRKSHRKKPIKIRVKNRACCNQKVGVASIDDTTCSDEGSDTFSVVAYTEEKEGLNTGIVIEGEYKCCGEMMGM